MEASRGSAPPSALLIRPRLLRSLSDAAYVPPPESYIERRYDFPHVLEGNVTTSISMAHGLCPVKRYNHQLRDLIIRGKAYPR